MHALKRCHLYFYVATLDVLLDHESIRWFVKKKTLKMEEGPMD